MSARPAHRDGAVAATALVLWLLAGLFVVYPLAMLLARVVVDNGAFNISGLGKVLTDKAQVRAFWNSLLLATIVGVGGTLLG